MSQLSPRQTCFLIHRGPEKLSPAPQLMTEVSHRDRSLDLPPMLQSIKLSPRLQFCSAERHKDSAQLIPLGMSVISYYN